MPFSCLVFDCDGVLLDSVPVKTRAFGRLAEPYGEEAVSRMIAFHSAHGGVSRYEKFAWFFKEVLGRPIREEESKEWGANFTRICREELAACPLIAGAEEVLRTFAGKMPLYVCSGAPAKEQQSVLEDHGLAKYFTAIYGAPPEKTALLISLLAENGIAPESALMIGDATTDLEAARGAGTQFYGVGSLLAGGNYPWGPDLTGLCAFVRAS